MKGDRYLMLQKTQEIGCVLSECLAVAADIAGVPDGLETASAESDCHVGRLTNLLSGISGQANMLMSQLVRIREAFDGKLELENAPPK
jgi:hypothetical protein